MIGKRALAMGATLAIFTASAGFAQEQDRDRFQANQPPPRYHGYWRDYGRCSLEQREYAYINKCGELIPGIWDPIPGSG